MRYPEHQWRLRNQLFNREKSPQVRKWLLATGSLTFALRDYCRDAFALELLRRAWLRPAPDEAALLLQPAADLSYIREVRLVCGSRPLVFARSIIPRTSLRGSSSRLARLGTRPLADLLFSNRSVTRTPMQFARLRPGTPLYATASHAFRDAGTFWARRTLFSYADRPLLVCEVFAPELIGA